MCLLMVAEKKFPDIKLLLLGQEQNPDGGGIAWRERGLVHYRKGLNADQIAKIGTQTRGPWLIHFRFATVGPAIGELCHPFPVTVDAEALTEGSSNAVLAHNGHWGEWRDGIVKNLGMKATFLPTGPWSDSRVMAWVAAHSGLSFLNSLTQQRIAYMTPRNLIRFGPGWKEIDDVQCSYDPIERAQVCWDLCYAG